MEAPFDRRPQGTPEGRCVMTELRIIRKATPQDLAPNTGRTSPFLAIADQIGDEWVVVFDGDAKRASALVSKASSKRTRALGLEVTRRRGVVMARRAPVVDAPSATTEPGPAASWYPEGLEDMAWADLRQRDRERCVAAIERLPKTERSAAMGQLAVGVDAYAATVKLLRSKGLMA